MGLRQKTRYEGQAAMDLEFAAEEDDSEEAYPMPLRAAPEPASRDGRFAEPCTAHAACESYQAWRPKIILNWGPMIEKLIEDLRAGLPVWDLSTKFHNTLAEGIVAVARHVGERRVVLTGGCFQNKYLVERTGERLRSEGFSPYWHQRVPPNDGGIALGQVIAASRARLEGNPPCA
jgi:hydrogenase maturation protein HypF